MKLKYHINGIFIVLFILILFLQITYSQTTRTHQDQQMSRQAQDLMKQKKWEEAIRILQEDLQNCGNAEEDKEYRAILNFNLGYIYYEMSEEDPDKRTTHLEKAAKFYKSALKNSPNNLDTINNLILVQWSLGNFQQAIDLVNRAIKIDSENPDTFWIALGDLYRETNNVPEALNAYKQASEINPSDETSHTRILSVYRSFPVDNLKMTVDLFTYCRNLIKINQRATAKNGLELVINRSFKTKESLAEDALILWAELGASRGWISKASLLRLPEENEWSSPAINELRELLTKSEFEEIRLEWWRKDDKRRHVAALIMMSIGRHLHAKGKIEDLEKIYELAIEIAPHHKAYLSGELRDKSIVVLDISSELAILYLNNPSLDPEGKKIDGLIIRLFKGKGQAYWMNALKAIQKYHTILGLIYAEKGQWKTRGADNAIFQLENALEKAKERELEDPKNYQPLPHLQSLLANGYVEVDDRRNAFSTYIDTAIGYLELDNMDMSETMLKNAESYINFSSVNGKRKLKVVINILNSRKQISRLLKDDLKQTSSDYIGKSPNYYWIFKPTKHTLDESHYMLNRSFVNRQRFKVLADLGNKAFQFELSHETQFFQTEALEIIKEEIALTNMNDIARLERIKSSALKDIRISKNKQVIGTGINIENNYNYRNGKIWWISSSSDLDPIQVGISSDLLLAATISNRINKEPSLTFEPLKLDLEGGIVTILEEHRDAEIIKKARETIINIEGVAKVDIRHEIR